MSSGRKMKDTTIRNRWKSVCSKLRRTSTRWYLGMDPSTRLTVEGAIVNGTKKKILKDWKKKTKKRVAEAGVMRAEPLLQHVVMMTTSSMHCPA